MALGPACLDVGFTWSVFLFGSRRRAMVRGCSPLAICMVVSSCASWMPSQNDPHTSHGVSLSSIMKLGSMAFQLLRFDLEAMMQPSSFHIVLPRWLVLSRPMAEPFLPKVEQLYAIHHLLCQCMMSGAHT